MALVINLDRSRDRWERVSSLLEAAGVPHERVRAVEGKSLGPEERARRSTWGCARFCSPSVLGCALSHVEAWKRIAADPDADAAYAVFEDDAEVPPDLLTKWAELAGDVPPDFDLVYLFDSDAYLLPPVGRLPHPRRRVSPRLVDPAFPLLSHAYVTTPRGAARALEALGRPGWHVDQELARLHGQGRLRIYAASPGFVDQAWADSTNAAMRFPLMARLPSLPALGSAEPGYMLAASVGRLGPVSVDVGSVVALAAGLAGGRWAAAWAAFLAANAAASGTARKIIPDLGWVAAGALAGRAWRARG